MLHDWPDAKGVRLVWHYLQFDKEMHSTRTQAQLDELKAGVMALIREIERSEKAKEFPTNVNEKCSWCEYKEMCPAWKHVEQTKKMTPREFKLDDGVKLADKYAQLKAKEKEFRETAGKELEAIEKQIEDYASQHGVQFIKGSGCTVKVATTQAMQFPTKTGDAKALAELEKLLKENGAWEGVSTLDPKKLELMIEAGKFTGELEKKIKAYCRSRTTTRLYLSVEKPEAADE